MREPCRFAGSRQETSDLEATLIDHTRTHQSDLNLCPSGQELGLARGNYLCRTGPGSDTARLPLPIDSSVPPFPVGGATHEWEHAAPADRPGSVVWSVDQPGLDVTWTGAEFTPKGQGYLHHASGLARS